MVLSWIVFLTETWLKDDKVNAFQIPNYNLFYKNRQNAAGGGVAIYIKDIFVCTSIAGYNDYFATFCEANFVEVIKLTSARKCVIGCIYHPPSGDVNLFNNMLEKFFSEIHQNKPFILSGDFNIDLLNFDTFSPCANFVDLLLSYNILPTINKPTRVTSHSATLIDNILVSSDFIEHIISSTIINL